MSDTDTIAHYRVKLDAVWLHAVALGSAAAVRKRLNDADSIWQREAVELVGEQPVDTWHGPFPRVGGIKQWLVEVR
jgi:hypothetical protein